MNNLTLERKDVRAIVEAMACYLEKTVDEISPVEPEDEPPFCGRVVDTRETPEDFRQASKEWTTSVLKIKGVELLHGERWLGGKWPRMEFLMATTSDGWTLDLIVRVFDRMTIDTKTGDADLDQALGGSRHAQMRAWMKLKGLTDESFSRGVPAPLSTARKWIYEGKPPRTANRTLLERSFPDCPALKWK